MTVFVTGSACSFAADCGNNGGGGDLVQFLVAWDSTAYRLAPALPMSRNRVRLTYKLVLSCLISLPPFTISRTSGAFPD
jgi:hypothetical protein